MRPSALGCALAVGGRIIGPMNLTNQFLIAMPSLPDPNFSRTVALVCAHNEDGAMGLVINRPLGLTLGEMLTQMDLACNDASILDRTVMQGGPVQPERGFVLHQPTGMWDAVLGVGEVGDGLGIAASRDILAAIAAGNGPARSLVLLGYAGWGAGQLEREVAENAWLSGPVDDTIIFDAPVEQRYELAARLLGVKLDRLSGQAGHA